MNIFILLFVFFAGHAFGALSFYFFHRAIFHGSLGRYPLLKNWKSIHTAHHADPEDPGNFFFPLWANILIWTMSGVVVWLTPAFGLGMFSFFALYSYRHRSAHTGANTRWAHHHMSHHTAFPRANFSGTYPVIDKLFGTYKSELVLVKHRER